MKRTKIIVLLIVVSLLLTSLTVMAKPSTAPGQQKEKNQNAPGQWKKTNEYESQEDFVFEVHMKIWQRLSQMGIQPNGLARLLGFSEDDGTREEPDEEPIEPPLLPVEGEPMD